MRFAYLVLLMSVVAVSVKSEIAPRYRPFLNLHPLPHNVKVNVKDVAQTSEYKDIVSYFESNLSANDIHDLLDALPEVMAGLSDEMSADEDDTAKARSVGSVVGNVFDRIPWSKITSYLQNMAKSNSKFQKVLNLVNDQKFRELVKKAVNSHTLAEFVKDVAEHGFSWTEFLHLLLHALCSTATTIQHDQYSVGACKILQNL